MLHSRRSVTLIAAGIAIVLACSSCSSSQSGTTDSAKTIVVGLDSVLSGQFAELGALGRGAQAYFDYVNSTGGVDGYKISTVTEDTANSGTQAISVTRQLIDSDHVNAVIGIGSDPLSALLSAIPNPGVPILFFGDGDGFVPPTHSQYYGLNVPYERKGAGLVEAARDVLKVKSLSISYQDDATGQPVDQGAALWARQNGMTIKATVSYPATISDCSAEAGRLRSAGTKVVIIVGAAPSAACVMKAAYALGYTPAWLSDDQALDPGEQALLTPAILSSMYAIDAYEQVVGNGQTAAQKLYVQWIKRKDSQDLTSSFAEDGWTMAAVLTVALSDSLKSDKKFSEANLFAALNSDFHGQPIALLPTVTYDSTQHAGVIAEGLLKLNGKGQGTQVSKTQLLPTP
jgi:ABC-type branched-subunit amino acid transport system substrate-binding protein